jgi:hypothetical protein
MPGNGERAATLTGPRGPYRAARFAASGTGRRDTATTRAGVIMADSVLEELLVSSEVQTARDRLEDYESAEAAANANPDGGQELGDLRDALVEMPGAVKMLLTAIDRAGASAGEPQYDHLTSGES